MQSRLLPEIGMIHDSDVTDIKTGTLWLCAAAPALCWYSKTKCWVRWM